MKVVCCYTVNLQILVPISVFCNDVELWIFTILLLVGIRCRFSQMLTPVFDEAGKQIKNDFPVCIAVS